mmetsp:Transcript_21705/g.26724  ORF Transcript_21705/g.26724 Transcript_21705/m.26724 type:complete len:81 (+) Transcript_21705:71-313(+)
MFSFAYTILYLICETLLGALISFTFIFALLAYHINTLSPWDERNVLYIIAVFIVSISICYFKHSDHFTHQKQLLWQRILM